MESKCNSKVSRKVREKCQVYTDDDDSWLAKNIFEGLAYEAGNERCEDTLTTTHAESTANTNHRQRPSTPISKYSRNIPIHVRNERERNRVRAVNEAFGRLRKIIPYTANRSKRVSKAKTLQKAVQYIHELEMLLMTGACIGYNN